MAAGLAVVLSLTSCYGPDEGSWVSRNPGRRVAIQADSLVALNDPQWERGTLARKGSLAVWSVSGSEFHQAGAWINGLSPRPDVFVIAQGTNSLADGWSRRDEVQLDRTIAHARDAGRAPRIPCIVLVTLAHGPDAGTERRREARRASTHIRRRAESSPVFRLAEWRAEALTRPEWFLDDQIHLTRAGSRAYERVITDAVRSC